MITICQNCDKKLLSKLEGFLNDESESYQKVECLEICQEGISIQKEGEDEVLSLKSEKDFSLIK